MPHLGVNPRPIDAMPNSPSSIRFAVAALTAAALMQASFLIQSLLEFPLIVDGTIGEIHILHLVSTAFFVALVALVANRVAWSRHLVAALGAVVFDAVRNHVWTDLFEFLPDVAVRHAAIVVLHITALPFLYTPQSSSWFQQRPGSPKAT